MRPSCAAALLAALFAAAPVRAEVDESRPGPHAQEVERHRFARPEPLALRAPSREEQAAQASAAPALAKRVWGYLPYWSTINLSTFRWDLISDLIIFSWGLSPSGTLIAPTVGSTVGWNVQTAIAAAKSHGVRVHLCITRFGNDTITTFLNDGSAKAAAAANMAKLAKDLGADGINLDFEFVVSTNKDLFSTFVEYSRAALRQQVPNGLLTLATPASLGYKGYDFPKLAQTTDGLLMMAYGYHYSGSGYTGPVSPLTKGGFWSSSIEADLAAILAVTPASALALGVPYYGYDWQASSTAVNASVLANTDGTAVLYKNIPAKIASYGRLWDAPSQTPWLHYTSSSVIHQLWFDDGDSLALKYRHARNKDLNGVMIWALGYDTGRTELWDAIQAELGAPVVTDGGSPDAGSDAGTDAGAPDAGLPDAGPADAGCTTTTSCGEADGGAPDAGNGAGEPQAAVAHGCGSSSTAPGPAIAVALLAIALMAARRRAR